MTRLHVTEYLDVDIEDETWHCNRCECRLGSAHSPYKEGCLVYERDPREIHPPLIDGPYTFSPDPAWVRIVEFYCPGCGVQLETEYLPPGHPITHDIEIDLERLKGRLVSGDLEIREGRLWPRQDPGSENG